MQNIRYPQFAGTFYPSNKTEILIQINNAYNNIDKTQDKKPALISLMPHAGYIYSGHIIAELLAQVELKRNLVILCPNHTGQGKPLSIWKSGLWQTPLGDIQVNSQLAEKLLQSNIYSASTDAHLTEHSIEVLLPFLIDYFNDTNFTILPICVTNFKLKEAAQILANNFNDDFSVIVSSDLNHFANQEQTLKLDKLALEAFMSLDAELLIDTIQKNKISMCGVYPAALALFFLKNLNLDLKANFIAHDTSGHRSSDFTRVVGYGAAYI